MELVGRVEITDLEIQNAPFMGNAKVTWAMLLRSKGVPMDGVFYPQPVPELIYTVDFDPILYKTTISWEQNQQEK